MVQVAHEAVELAFQALAFLGQGAHFALHVGHRFFGLLIRLVGYFTGRLAGFVQQLLGLKLGFAHPQIGLALGLLRDGVAGVLGRFQGAVEAGFDFAHLLHVLLGVFELEAQLPVFVAQPLPLLRNQVQKRLHFILVDAAKGFLLKGFLPDIEGGNFHLFNE